MKTRNRLAYALLLALTIFLGLVSRRLSSHLPTLLAKNTGDVLYATMVFWLIGFVFPRLSTAWTALMSMLFCFGIEFLKFSQSPWLVAARHNKAGALIFGVGFHTSNLICYTLGVGIATALELLYVRRHGLGSGPLELRNLNE